MNVTSSGSDVYRLNFEVYNTPKQKDDEWSWAVYHLRFEVCDTIRKVC